MVLFGEYNAWLAYARTRAVEAEKEEDEFEAELRSVGAFFVLERAEGEKITDARLRRDTDPAIRALQADHLSKRYVRKYAVALMENMQAYAAFVSRELTRRTEGGALRRRNDRWNT